jgi:NitT/TauT family transport system substrate-binding protein
MHLKSAALKGAASLAAIAAVVSVLSACSSKEEPGNITFAMGAPVLIDSTAPYASVPTALNYWKSEGLNVNLQPTQGATASMQLLLAGKADITNGGSSSFYQAAVQSPEIRVISLQTRNIWQVTVPEDSPIKTIPELKGKTIGVQSLSSASYLFGRAAVAASGLDADADVKWLAVGVGNQAAQALQSGTVAAYASYDGPSGVVGSLLHKKMINLPTPLDAIQGLGGIATTEKFLREHRDIVIKFLRGVNKGALFAATNPAAALQIQWKAYPEQKPKDMSTEEAIKAAMVGVESRFQSNGEPGASGLLGDVPMAEIQKSIDFMLKYGIIKTRLDANKVADMSVSADANKFDAEAIKKQARDWKP